MIDMIMYRQMQRYREEWYEAKAAVEHTGELHQPADIVHTNYQVRTKQWVARLLPLDTVEDAYQEIWHERQFGPFNGLKDAYENGLQGDDSDPLDTELLTEIGKAAEEITVDVTDLPEQPPVDPDPWNPDPERTAERLRELRSMLPDDIDTPGYE
jgi:hypothetical protein